MVPFRSLRDSGAAHRRYLKPVATLGDFGIGLRSGCSPMLTYSRTFRSSPNPELAGQGFLKSEHGGSINLNVRYHVAIPSGVFTFTSDDAPATFHSLPAPDTTDLEDTASDVAIRTLTWLVESYCLGPRCAFRNYDVPDGARTS